MAALQNQYIAAIALNNIGVTLLQCGRYQQAVDTFADSVYWMNHVADAVSGNSPEAHPREESNSSSSKLPPDCPLASVAVANECVKVAASSMSPQVHNHDENQTLISCSINECESAKNKNPASLKLSILPYYSCDEAPATVVRDFLQETLKYYAAWENVGVFRIHRDVPFCHWTKNAQINSSVESCILLHNFACAYVFLASEKSRCESDKTPQDCLNTAFQIHRLVYTIIQNLRYNEKFAHDSMTCVDLLPLFVTMMILLEKLAYALPASSDEIAGFEEALVALTTDFFFIEHIRTLLQRVLRIGTAPAA